MIRLLQMLGITRETILALLASGVSEPFENPARELDELVRQARETT